VASCWLFLVRVVIGESLRETTKECVNAILHCKTEELASCALFLSSTDGVSVRSLQIHFNSQTKHCQTSHHVRSFPSIFNPPRERSALYGRPAKRCHQRASTLALRIPQGQRSQLHPATQASFAHCDPYAWRTTRLRYRPDTFRSDRSVPYPNAR
jgi:hypothetical protein